MGQAYKLNTNLFRAGKVHPAGSVLDDLSDADIASLGDMAVPVEAAGGDDNAGGNDNTGGAPKGKTWSDAERAAVAEQIDGVVQAGVSESAAIKSIKQSDPSLPGVRALRKWYRAWRAPKPTSAE